MPTDKQFYESPKKDLRGRPVLPEGDSNLDPITGEPARTRSEPASVRPAARWPAPRSAPSAGRSAWPPARSSAQ